MTPFHGIRLIWFKYEQTIYKKLNQTQLIVLTHSFLMVHMDLKSFIRLYNFALNRWLVVAYDFIFSEPALSCHNGDWKYQHNFSQNFKADSASAWFTGGKKSHNVQNRADL